MVNPNTSLAAMYIIGKTESNNTWDSINYNDPITVGMMQWFGTRAAGYLHMISDQWDTFTASIRSSLETHSKDDGAYWPSRFLTRDEGESMRAAMRSENGKLAQMDLWESDYAANVARLSQWGFSEDRPQPLILLMSALHQSPARAVTIARNYGGNSSLNRIYQAIANEPVLSRYLTHRYRPTRDWLASWDGVSPPPDFGQVHGDYVPPGDDQPGVPGPEQPSPDDPADSVEIRHIQQVGDHLHLFMADGSRRVAYATAIQQWGKIGGRAIVPPPPEVEPPDTPEPPAPSPGAWAHPVPARSRVSSEYGPRGGGMHRGIDFAAPMGTPMYAVAAGTVLRAGTATGFGGYIAIKLDDSPYAVGYGHMKTSSFRVKTGDRVTKGQHIADVASEGQSSGPHLHFEVYSGGVMFQGHINPRPVLESNGVTP